MKGIVGFEALLLATETAKTRARLLQQETYK